MGWFEDIGRGLECFGQGVVQGVVGGVASVGDFAVDVGYNWTTRNAINAFRSEDSQLGAFKPNLADGAAEAVTWTEPQNDYERALMATGRATGEVVGFAATVVATGGVGGAVYGAVRGGAAVTRAGTVALRTAEVMNPIASPAVAAIEGGFVAFRATQLFNQDAEALRNATEIGTVAATGALDKAAAEQQYLNTILAQQQKELGDLITELQGGVSQDRHTAIETRLDQITEAKGVIDRLRTPGITEDQRNQDLQRLHELYPDISPPASMLVSSVEPGISSPYAGVENAGVLTAAFTDTQLTQTALPLQNEPAVKTAEADPNTVKPSISNLGIA